MTIWLICLWQSQFTPDISSLIVFFLKSVPLDNHLYGHPQYKQIFNHISINLAVNQGGLFFKLCSFGLFSHCLPASSQRLFSCLDLKKWPWETFCFLLTLSSGPRTSPFSLARLFKTKSNYSQLPHNSPPPSSSTLVTLHYHDPFLSLSSIANCEIPLKKWFLSFLTLYPKHENKVLLEHSFFWCLLRNKWEESHSFVCHFTVIEFRDELNTSDPQ